MPEKIIAYKIEEQMSCENEKTSVKYDIILNHEGIRFNSWVITSSLKRFIKVATWYSYDTAGFMNK